MRTSRYLASAVLLGLSAVALAQAPGPAQSSPQSSEAAAKNQGDASIEARKLIGKTIQTPAGESLGKVSDVLLDEAQGRSYVIVAYGQRRFAAIPLDRARAMVRKDVLVLERDQLEKAPVLEDQSWRQPGSGHWTKSTDDYWQNSDKTRSASEGTQSDPAQERR
jgi:sporulation protein YlmC with PRC-barrel domain